MALEAGRDNQQLAIDEVTMQITNLDLTVSKMTVTDSHSVDNTEDDWFDDYVFTMKATVISDKLTEPEIREILSNGPFESCEF